MCSHHSSTLAQSWFCSVLGTKRDKTTTGDWSGWRLIFQGLRLAWKQGPGRSYL